MLQHKDDPLFIEFIEAHVNDKTAWIKEALQSAAKSDDEDSGVDEDNTESHKDTPVKVDEDSNKEQEKKDEKKQEKKVANKNISDLEVNKIMLLVF